MVRNVISLCVTFLLFSSKDSSLCQIMHQAGMLLLQHRWQFTEPQGKAEILYLIAFGIFEVNLFTWSLDTSGTTLLLMTTKIKWLPGQCNIIIYQFLQLT